jgi:tRNA A37 methylthiotransferase MiaB
MPGHLSPHTIKERAACLREIAERKKSTYLERFLGAKLDFLVQGYNDTTAECSGLSRNYIYASFHGDKALLNEEVSVFINASNGKQCSGETGNLRDN